MRSLLVALVLLLPAAAAAQPVGGPPAPSPSPALDSAHRSVSTHSQAAQRAFDEGLTLLDAFNPAEARRAFHVAVAADPDLAMAYWGIAMSYGVNINTTYDPASQRHGRDAIAQAQLHAATASPADQALIAAAAKRYAFVADGDAARSAQALADAMSQAAIAFPGDDDVLTLAAESELDVHPWDQWTDAGKAEPGTQRAIAWLGQVLARDPAHPQANHLLIHALEASPRPQDALAAARRLAAERFEPGAEHLTHMPAHIFMRVGDYAQAGDSNAAAINMFTNYLDGPHEDGHQSYLGHDCEFAVDAFMMAGEYASARRSAAECGDRSRRLLAYAAIRFHRWQDLAPEATVTTFSDGVAALQSGHLEQAQHDARTLAADKSGTAPIAARVLLGEIDATRSHMTDEIADLTAAVALQDHLGYSEPPQWFFPIRETLGAAYFAAGRFADAEATFRADLERNRNNPRSLFGLAETLEREGRANDAAAAHRAFVTAWAHADAPLTMQDL